MVPPLVKIRLQSHPGHCLIPNPFHPTGIVMFRARSEDDQLLAASTTGGSSPGPPFPTTTGCQPLILESPQYFNRRLQPFSIVMIIEPVRIRNLGQHFPWCNPG